MNSHDCAICKSYNGFFVWSTDRRFNRRKLAELCGNAPKGAKNYVFNESYTVCLDCVRKYGLLE